MVRSKKHNKSFWKIWKGLFYKKNKPINAKTKDMCGCCSPLIKKIAIVKYNVHTRGLFFLFKNMPMFFVFKWSSYFFSSLSSIKSCISYRSSLSIFFSCWILQCIYLHFCCSIRQHLWFCYFFFRCVFDFYKNMNIYIYMYIIIIIQLRLIHDK